MSPAQSLKGNASSPVKIGSIFEVAADVVRWITATSSSSGR